MFRREEVLKEFCDNTEQYREFIDAIVGEESYKDIIELTLLNMDNIIDEGIERFDLSDKRMTVELAMRWIEEFIEDEVYDSKE